MSCPTDAQLRTHIDEPDPTIVDHVAGCDDCTRRARDLSAHAEFVAGAMAHLAASQPGSVDVEAAYQAVRRRPATAAASGTSSGAPPGSARAAGVAAFAAGTPSAMSASTDAGSRLARFPASIAAAVVALAVAALVALTPTGREAAANFLDGFRAERFEVVTFDPEQPMAGLEQLGEIVEVRGDAEHGDPVEVADLAAAAEISGFTAEASTALPAGATLRTVQAAAPRTVQLVLHGDRAPDLPAELDGAALNVRVPGMVAAMYDVDGRALVVGEAGQLTVDAEGAELEQIRAYLLDRPEVPNDLADQLLAIDDWTTTIPVPVPIDDVVWRETTVGDAPGLMLDDTFGAGLVWQADGHIHAVGGENADVDELRVIADGIN